MRPFSTYYYLAVCLLSVLALTGQAHAAPAASGLTVDAARLAFYNDQFLLEGDGNVRVSLSDGTQISGDAFSMDLKLNRFLVAGHVKLAGPGGTLSGAAIADFLEFNRVYFIPVTASPDRWTYLDGDYQHPAKGREMPGDAFAFPDLTNAHPTVLSHSAVVGAKRYVRFGASALEIAGAGVPVPSYYVNFSSDPNLAQNSLSGSSFDLTYNMTGNAHSVSALHARYDSVNRTYLSFEQHFSGAHEWAVFSVNPMTRPDKYWNLLLDDRLGSRLEFRSFTQLHTQQSWLSSPIASSQYTYVYGTQAFNHSSLQAVATFTDYNLLGIGTFTAPNPSYGALSHPANVQFTMVGFPNKIGKTPFYESTRFGYGWYHDSYTFGQSANPVQYEGITYINNYNRLVGLTVYEPQIKLGDRDNPYKTYVLTSTYDQQRTWYSVPHYVDNISGTASLSRTYSRAFSSYLQYNVVQTNDIYSHGGYGSCVVPPNTPPTCYEGFLGKSTLRTTSLGLNFAPSPYFYAGVTGRYHDDFPKPVPSLASIPPLNVLGQQLYNNYLGQPPYDVTAEVRAPVLPHLTLDVQRTYYFNFGNVRWSPQFIVQVVSQ